MILLTSRPDTAAISYDPPNGRVESAGEGAAAAARSALDTPSLGHPQLEAVVGVLGSAVAPFAAAYGAVKASQQRLSPDKLSAAEDDLAAAMRSNAGPEVLRQKVADAAQQKTCRLLTCAPFISAVPANRVPVSAVLTLAVEQLSLKAAKAGKSDFVLFIEASARLIRASDGAVLLNRSYQYTSGPALFIDWTRHRGLESVAQTGYQSLAERIAEDVFQPVSEPPLLIGPGQKHSSSGQIVPVAGRHRALALERAILIAPVDDLSGKHARLESCAPPAWGQCPVAPSVAGEELNKVAQSDQHGARSGKAAADHCARRRLAHVVTACPARRALEGGSALPLSNLPSRRDQPRARHTLPQGAASRDPRAVKACLENLVWSPAFRLSEAAFTLRRELPSHRAFSRRFSKHALRGLGARDQHGCLPRMRRCQQIGASYTMNAPALQFVSAGQDNVTSIEVYTGKTDQHLGVRTPDSGVEGTTDAPSDTKWAMDGLEHDRNSVVQAVSCLAVIPLGLWEQTVGAVIQHSRNKTEKLAADLDAIPDRGHFAGKLADEVARRLSSQVANQVQRREEPPRFALALGSEPAATGATERRAPANSQLALLIEVSNTRLVGRHRGSRSRALCMQMQARIIRASDGQELYSRPILYRSASRNLKDWAASDAKLFRQELEACSRQTAQAVTAELVGRGFVKQNSASPAPSD